MTVPDRPLSHRRAPGSGDAWVQGPQGQRYWGTFGAAGLLVVAPEAGVLLQHRVQWSHFGGTWGIPGGARHENETAAQGALREAVEEAGVPVAEISPAFRSVLDMGWWSYTTVVAHVAHAFDPVVSDPESLELRWVPARQVAAMPLHPRFAERWPALHADLAAHHTLLIDAANVVGSRPDGWWRDRAAAAGRLAELVGALWARGIPAGLLGAGHDAWWPETVLVVEGQARALTARPPGVQIVRAPADGDSAIIRECRERRGASQLTVVTADAALRRTVAALGARTVSPGALWAQLDGLG